jgi:glycine/D-amino acid oxidase-like deaminating enzyme
MSDLLASLPAACDVVVLGGGASGSSIAYQLAKRGVEVLLLEAGDIGQGASGRNGGLLDTAVDPGSPLVDYYYRSAELWPGLAEELGDTTGIDVEYLRAGTLQIVLEGDPDKDEIDEEFRGHLERGYDVRWLDHAETLALSRLFPENTLGGWHRPMDGQVNPLMLCYALALGTTRHGGRVRQNTPATALLVETPGGVVAAEPRRYPGVTGARTAGCDSAPAGKVVGVRTPEGDVRCDQLVVALEPWTRPFLTPLGLDVPVRPQRGQIFVTEPLPPLMEVACLYGVSPYIYWRQTRHGGLTIGGARPQDVHGDFLLDSVGAATTLDIQRIVLDMVARVHPSLADVAVIRWWGGVMGFTADLLPVLGRLDEHPNVVTACGFCPNGILCAPMTGHVIADVVTGATPDVPLEAYALRRFAAVDA